MGRYGFLLAELQEVHTILKTLTPFTTSVASLHLSTCSPLRALDHTKVLCGSKYCGKAADCWSVGATLFTMLAGFSPFKTDETEVRNGRQEGDCQTERGEAAVHTTEVAYFFSSHLLDVTL